MHACSSQKNAHPINPTWKQQYEGRRLEIQTILEEDELAPLFDGAYWPGTYVLLYKQSRLPIP